MRALRCLVGAIAMFVSLAGWGQDGMLLGGAASSQAVASDEQATIRVERRAVAVSPPAGSRFLEPVVAPPGAVVGAPEVAGTVPTVPSTMSGAQPAGDAVRDETGDAEAASASDVAAFAGGLPAAYVEVAREIEARVRDHARTSAEAMARVQGSFGALGMDFSDTDVRAEARDEMNTKLGLIRYYSGAMETLADAVVAQDAYRSAQAKALISEAKSLADLHGALDGLGRQGVKGDGEAYALAALNPSRIFLSRDAAVFPIRVRALAHPVSIETARMLVQGGGAQSSALRLDPSECEGVSLGLGEDCVLTVHYAGLGAGVPAVPSGFVSVGLVSDAVEGAVRQMLAVRFGALPTPPQAQLRLEALETAAAELQTQTRDSIGALEQTLDMRIETLSDVVERMVQGAETRLAGVETQAGEALKAVEVVQESSMQMKQALDAEIEARKGMEDRIETTVVAEAEQVVASVTAALIEEVDRRLMDTGAMDGRDDILGELYGRVAELEGRGGALDTGMAPARGGMVSIPERVRIVRLMGRSAQLEIVGPAGTGVSRVTLSQGDPLPERGWTLQQVLPGRGRIDLRDPSGDVVSVYPKAWPVEPERAAAGLEGVGSVVPGARGDAMSGAVPGAMELRINEG